MIKVNKNLEDIPNSLINEGINNIRIICIQNEEYYKKFNQRFKQRDTKRILKRIYYNKCVFCEQRVIGGDIQLDNKSTIEHYRPKSKYYWLAFSWDNLLWCCHRCNQNKGNKFEVIKNLGTFHKITFFKKIHKTAKIYNRIEKPKMIHPELESIKDKLSFNDGIINSADIRVKYTIDTCILDRDDLNEKRKTIMKSFKDKINERKFKKKPYNDILENLISDFKNPDNEFRALRYWILKNHSKLI